jgi:hypothetical protein
LTDRRVASLFPPEAQELLEVKGIQLVEKLGIDAIRDVVLDVLSGVNLRNATETLTRRRISMLNAALLVTYLRAGMEMEGFADEVEAELRAGGMRPSDKRILRWMLGLTEKQVQNVLRSDDTAWEHYVVSFKSDLEDAAARAEELYGELRIGDGATVDWRWMLHLMVAVGAQTLATRGSEKSMYGKFFEKLILGGVLHAMGLTLVAPDDTSVDRVFWLSSRGRKRESDATALFEKGVGVRFDIGFIGTGNTELSLDKVSRFEREVEIGGESHFMHTFIIVDRIGARSRIVELAKEIDGTILQMSASYWPRELGAKLAEVIDGFESPLAGMSDSEVHAQLAERVATAPFGEILRIEEEDDPEADEPLFG